MGRSSAELKRIARKDLRGHWGFIIGITVLSGAIVYIAELPFYAMLTVSQFALSQFIAYFIATIIISVLSMVLQCGISRVHLAFARNQQTKFGMLFGEFTNRPDRYILGILLLMGMETACVIPGYIMFLVGIFADPVLLTVLGTLVLIGGIIGMVMIALRYAMVFILLVDYPQMKVMEAFKESSRLMKGRKGRLFYINLSFIGWSMLSVFSCGLGLLWILPYMSQTSVSFYRDITGELERKSEPGLDEEKHNDTTSFGEYTV